MDFDYRTSLPSICTPVTMGAVVSIHECKGKQEASSALPLQGTEYWQRGGNETGNLPLLCGAKLR